MTNPQLQQSLVELAVVPRGLVGICAETIDGRHLVEINADEVFPAASSIKMYVLFTLLKKADAGQIALEQRIQFTAEAAKPGSGVLYHLDRGLRLTLKDLATLMMMISDNSALILLTDYLGIDAINSEIDALGMHNTRYGDWSNFENDYTDTLGFGQGTPREFTHFLLRMRGDDLLSASLREVFWDTLRIQKYIEPLRRLLPASPWSREFGLPEPVWVASKSGVLDDCASESGFINVNNGGWAISVMLRGLPFGDSDSIKKAEQLISQISLRIYEAWSPLYHLEDST